MVVASRSGSERRRHGALARRGYALRRGGHNRMPRFTPRSCGWTGDGTGPGDVCRSFAGRVPRGPSASADPSAARRSTSPRQNNIVRRLRGVIRNSRTALASFMHG